MRMTWMVGVGLLVFAGTGPGVRAEDGEPPGPAPAAAPPAAEPPTVLPPVVITAPRVHAAPGTTPTGEPLVTSLRHEAEAFDVPHAVTILPEGDIRERRVPRNLPDVLLRLPSVMVQKTGPGQSSPFIRGFTGFHNVFLIDGIRLNNSVFREGPNQYWSTVDPWSISRVEVVRGPHSVLYGSDAVGGTVNAFPRRRETFCLGDHASGGVLTRAATAEAAWAGRIEGEGNADRLGWAAGLTTRHYGDLRSGGGRLDETAYDEWAGDVRFDALLRRDLTLTLGAQRVVQVDVPRTHTTVFAKPFHGTSVGTDLERDLAQRRALVYGRATWDGRGPRAELTVSFHRQVEDQERLRTNGRKDLQGFDVDTYGVQAQVETPTCLGHLTWGADAYHDEVDSFRHDYVNDVFTLTEVQGPVGDDGSYDLAGVFVQDEVRLGRLDLVAGVRFAYARAYAGRVDDPQVAGSDPATPGNVMSVEDEWTNLVGSLRGTYHLSERWNLYGGVSQAFRTPTLSDLTTFEATSAFEVPTPGLEPDEFVSFEWGVKTEQRRVSANAAAWLTLLDDVIVQSPTGNLVNGVPEVRKDNVGDGWMFGLEAEGAFRITPCWTAIGNATWQRGEVDQIDTTGTLVRAPASRLMPLSGLLGLRYEPPGGRFWAQAEVVAAAKQSRLALRDERDTQRIPPGGTPGWAVVNLRAGYAFSRHAHLTVAIENLLDKDYRIHGSGVNEPGWNLVVGLNVRF